MEEKKFEKLNDLDLEMASGGTGEVKGSPTYNPLTECPNCTLDYRYGAAMGPRYSKRMEDGYMCFVCFWCGRIYHFDEDGNMHWERGA